MARRLWARFEVLPFRYGLGTGIVAVVVAALVIAGFVTLGGGPEKKQARPGPVRSGPVEAAVPPAPTWGYIPPRQARSTTAVVSPSPTHAAKPTSPRPRPARPSTRSSSTSTCPATLKKTKWGWVYEMCKRKQNG
ncbi:MAG TPA: hypothetical protein VE198_25640 [Actinoallomurus sp.]|jgi:hypothetical protein|nr:hypothetical protein [Actinoallomurus sp.]